MIDHIERIRKEGEDKLRSAPSLDELEKLRLAYLGKKGAIINLLHQLKDLSQDKRREVGALLNIIKDEFEKIITERRVELHKIKIENEINTTEQIDLSLPGSAFSCCGKLHPISLTIKEFTLCLEKVGFSVVTGPEVETEYYNFEALNTPKDHPARDLQDTFYIKDSILLRSHTSPVQIRTMQKHRPPLQIIAPGKVYRSDYDATHTPMFHQIEGLMVDKNISMANLKAVIHYIVKELFGQRGLRFRPSYFPFTEPSAEVDMKCIKCSESSEDCKVCSGTGWLEIAGCGMVHPNVFRAVNIDPDEYTGFAFGFGIERIAMLKYGIDDLRSFFENDIRMLEQF